MTAITLQLCNAIILAIGSHAPGAKSQDTAPIICKSNNMQGLCSGSTEGTLADGIQTRNSLDLA